MSLFESMQRESSTSSIKWYSWQKHNFFAISGDQADKGFYRWTNKYGLERLHGSYKTSNSLTFDYKRNILYHMDGCEQIVRSFKVNKKSGKICKLNNNNMFRQNINSNRFLQRDQELFSIISAFLILSLRLGFRLQK